MITRRQFLLSSAVTVTIAPYAWRNARAADRLPFKLFDTHAHLITEDRIRYPRPAANAVAPMGAAPAGANAAGMGVPGAGAGPNSTGKRETPQVEKVLQWMDENGVEGGAAVQHRGTYGYDNSYILDSADRFKDRFVPVAVLDAQDAKTPGMVRELVKTRGLAGVRITGMRAEGGGFPWLSSDSALATWTAVDETGLVMDIMTSPPGKSPEAIAEYIKLAQKFPNARLVLDHVAWPNAEGAPEYGIDATHRELAKYKNIYYKFTTINLDMLNEGKVSAAEMLRRIVDVYGADRIMWGSDIGNSAGLYGEMVERIVAVSVKLSDAEKRKVLHDTGKAVFARGGLRAGKKAA